MVDVGSKTTEYAFGRERFVVLNKFIQYADVVHGYSVEALKEMPPGVMENPRLYQEKAM